MPVSQFKATCLRVLQRVKRTGRPVVVTRFGQPVAEIVPPRAPRPNQSWIGCLKGSGRTVGDIVSPSLALQEWNAIRS